MKIYHEVHVLSFFSETNKRTLVNFQRSTKKFSFMIKIGLQYKSNIKLVCLVKSILRFLLCNASLT